MNRDNNRVTMLQIPLTEEKYGRAAVISFAVHGAALFILIFGIKLFPQTVIQLGGGPGGGFGGTDIATVGITDQFSGGAGMVKPSLVPQPPAIVPAPENPKPKIPEAENNAIPIPEKIETPKKKQPDPKPKSKSEAKTASAPAAKTTAKPTESTTHIGNAVPVDARPGSGGIAGAGSGSGGGIGGGSGVSIGTGSGGFGDSWYAQAVERRISAGWIRPAEGTSVDVTYSFFINRNGEIYDIKREKSSGNPQIDRSVERAISLVKGLPAPPREFQGKAIQFVARFVHPPESLEN